MKKIFTTLSFAILAVFSFQAVGATLVEGYTDADVTISYGTSAEVGYDGATTTLEEDMYLTGPVYGIAVYSDDNDTSKLYVNAYNWNVAATFHIGFQVDGVLTYQMTEANIVANETADELWFIVEANQDITEIEIGLLGNAVADDWETVNSGTNPYSTGLTMPPNPTIIEQVFTWLTDIVTGFIGVMTAIFANDGIIVVFYDSVTGLTLVGSVLLLVVGLSLVRFGFNFVRRLITMRG